MYISAIRKDDNVLVWERNDEGRSIKQFEAPYYFYTRDKKGKYVGVYGEKLTKHEFRSSRSFHKAKQDFESSRVRMYESDIAVELKILSEFYYNAPIPKLHVTFLDIEVDYDPQIGFSSVRNPYAPINSVALYHRWKEKYVVLAVPPEGWNGKLDPSLRELADITICKNEKELLTRLLYEIEDSDVLCGWNSDFFDMPYIGKRVQQVLGDVQFERLSFEQAQPPTFREVIRFGNVHETIDLSGRLSVDYLALFQKYEMEGRPSYKLESIAEEVLPHLPKLTYEGSLHNLYRSDFNFFIRYNIRDTEILEGFEQKLGYVELANNMYHLSTGLIKHVTGTLKLVDLAIINYCHYELGGVCVPDYSEGIDGQIEGALVLFPQIQMHDWLGSIDINSLYPSSIRSINISPETLRGQFVEKGKAWEAIHAKSELPLTLRLEDRSEYTATAQEWNEFLKQKRWAISGYGTVYDQSKKGIIPSILEGWYAKRKEYQALKKEAEKKGDKDKAAYYDRLQYVYKIKLNSTYGALTNYFFRFFDLRMGESVTGTGRAILKHQCRKVAEILDGKYLVEFPLYETPADVADTNQPADVTLHGPGFRGHFQSESVIYGDTDSVYFKTHASTKEEAIAVADAVAKQVNESFPAFMREAFLCTEGYDTLIKSAREVVSDRGIFVNKKRYALHVVDKEGKPSDSLKIMGLELKKTTLPKPIALKLTSFVERLLKREDWDVIAKDIVDYKKELMQTKNIMEIGLPKGIKGIEEYTQKYKVYGADTTLPGHVAAAIHFNECLVKYDDKECLPISSGAKIKVFYLKGEYGKFKSIALPTDIENIPTWFQTEFAPHIARDEQMERLVDKPLQHIFLAIDKQVPNEQSLLMDDLFSF